MCSVKSKKIRYKSSDLAIIIPTRNREKILRHLLNSILEQDLPLNSIIIVSSGDEISNCINQYRDKLPIIYHHSEEGGQIHQRNLGINLLPQSVKLAASLDDDIVLCPNSIKNIIDYWNTIDEDTAGIGFNIINEKPHNPSGLLTSLYLTSKIPGIVMKSGVSTSVCNINQNISTSWLLGEASIWRKEILTNYKHQERSGSWAVGEDVFFSYPLSKRYRMYVCADAKVRHEHVNDQFIKSKVFYKKGRAFALWRLHFVINNKDLSVPAYIYVMGMTAMGKIITGLLKRNPDEIRFSNGIIVGIFYGLIRYCIRKPII